MRIRFTPLFLALFMLLAASPAPAQNPAPDQGFNGIAWGAQRKDQKDFFRLKTKGNAAFFSNTKETYFVKGYLPPKVLYGFLNDQLFAVYIVIKDQKLFDYYDQKLQAEYGAPEITQENDTRIRRWKSSSVKIKLKHNAKTGDMKLAYYYAPLSEKVDLEAVGDAFEDINRNKTDELYRIEQWRRTDM
jgi:hypothetical protein